MTGERRIGVRVPLEMFVNQYIRDRPFRALTEDVSETGILVSRVPLPGLRLAAEDQVVGLEFELPGTGEMIWARGQVCHERRGGPITTAGVRFAAMPRVHARLVRDYCVERRRARLAAMLERVRRQRPSAQAG